MGGENIGRMGIRYDPLAKMWDRTKTLEFGGKGYTGYPHMEPRSTPVQTVHVGMETVEKHVP